MAGSALARRYARALFGLVETPQERRTQLAELDELSELIEGDEALRRAVFTPLYPRAERRAVLHELAERLGLHRDLQRFSALLVEENRTRHLPQIRDELRTLVERAEGRVEARVTSARPLEPEEVQRVRTALAERVGSDVQIEVDVDPGLIGGLVARIGDLLLDASVRTQLATLAGSLRKGSA
jgi:F-type H+-transporting ATPase subunit delta